MSFYRGPKVITNGLYALYDAGDRNSYPGTGNTWFDLSGNGRHGTLNNGVAYTQGPFNTLTFDGVDDYVNLPIVFTQAASTDMYTVFAVAKLSSTSGARRQILGSDNGGYDWGFGAGDSTQFHIFSGENIYTSVAQDLNWHVFTAQWSPFGTRLYLDNRVIVNTANVGYDSSIAASTDIGRNPGYGEYWHGNIAVVQIYNRYMSETEITQNNNALRGRFGI